MPAPREEARWFKRVTGRGRTPAAIPSSVTFDQVSHAYDETLSVDGLSLDIRAGEVVCLLGHSGCGKTTLLRLAAGLEMPSSGRILINGQEVSRPGSVLAPERRGVGLMFQEYALFPHLTNLANVVFGLRALGAAEAGKEALRALERVGLADYADLHPHQLSGGEQQRVALARAIAPRPGVLLMDEPFSGLDRRLRDEVRDGTLAVLRESHVTAIIVTHDPDEALRLADRIALMRSGRLIQVDRPEAIYRAPANLFAARFFSELNEVPGSVQDGQVVTSLGAFPAGSLSEGTAAIAAIRPQGLSILPQGGGADATAPRAKVLRRRFLGEVDQLDLAVEGLDAPLEARVRSGSVDGASEVAIVVDPAEVLVFAASDA